MITFLLTFAISFILLLFLGFFISYSKRRQRRTSHGLTGMCHETGGEMCGCCSASLVYSLSRIQESRHPRSCRSKIASTSASRKD